MIIAAPRWTMPKNVPAALSFYRDRLGFDIIDDEERRDAGNVWFHVSSCDETYNGRSLACAMPRRVSNGTSRCSASPRRFQLTTTLVRFWIRIERFCSASTGGARTSITATMPGRVTRKPCNRVVTLHGDVTTASHPSSVDADQR
jgi:hypothetical protein